MTSPEPETSGQDAVSDEAVEAAARALWDDLRGNFMGRWMPEWADAKAGEQDAARDSARAILTAAAPHIRADERARVLGEVQEALRQRAAQYDKAAWLAGEAHLVAMNYRDAADYLAGVLGGMRQEAPAERPSAAVDGLAGPGAVVGTGEASEAISGGED